MSVTYKSKLLDQYHHRQALSAIPTHAPYFQWGNVKWGYGLIDDSGAETVLKDIPGDFSAMDETFAIGTAVYSYSGGKTIITATFPKDQIPDGESRNWSMVQIDDADGVAVGAMVREPVVISNQMDISVTFEVNVVNGETVLSPVTAG